MSCMTCFKCIEIHERHNRSYITISIHSREVECKSPTVPATVTGDNFCNELTGIRLGRGRVLVKTGSQDICCLDFIINCKGAAGIQ